MALSNIGGGRQVGDGNVDEVSLVTQGAPATMTVTAAVTVAQLVTGIILGNPDSSAASYTLPTVALTEALLVNAKVDSAFDVSVINVDGSGSGVITMVAGTGWTLVGLVTLAATAGTTGRWRARKTGVGTWSLSSLA